MAASDAINNFPETAKSPFNVVRTGINLHGSFDPYGRKALKVEPVLTLKTRVAQVRELPAGTTLGYGRTWCLNASTRVATISAGYADGLPRLCSNKCAFAAGSGFAPQRGSICMDMCMIDLTDLPEVSVGDEVEIFGTRSSVETLAAAAGTISYELLCALSKRVPRVYKNF